MLSVMAGHAHEADHDDEPGAAGPGDHGHGDPGHGHGHGQGHGQGAGDEDGSAAGEGPGRWARLTAGVRHSVTPHSHDAADQVDTALESSREGMRALWISLAVLGATSLLQAVVVVISGSVALLGDTVHNLADALTAVPLAIAFTLGRRLPTRRYTYGYGRSEDLAGVAIVVTIAASGVFAAVAAVRRLADPQEVTYLGAVAAAGLIGFVGNELVARYRITVGRRIGSAALVADGLHARTDGFTSLAVLVGAGGVALGFPLADPIVGLLITVAILVVLRDAARQVYRRLMDAVDPELVTRCEQVLREVPDVLDVGAVRVRWIGHELHADADVELDAASSLVHAHDVCVRAERALKAGVPRLTGAVIHPDPVGTAGRGLH